ncbi:FRA10AC1-like protein [Drosera capensis]
MTSLRLIKSSIYDREERKQQYQAHVRGLNAFDRHRKFVDDYVRYYGKGAPSGLNYPIKTDQDTLREGYRFIRTEEDDNDTSWEQSLVKRYYDKLFKEYCIADMSHYKIGKIGLRWRTEKEVVSGKGQFICGNKHCDEKDKLASYEASIYPYVKTSHAMVNFSYIEAGESKQALVKLVACERRCCVQKNFTTGGRRKKRNLKEQSKNSQRERETLPSLRGLSKDDSDEDHEHKHNNRKRKDSDNEEKKESRYQERKRERTKIHEVTDEKNKANKKRDYLGLPLCLHIFMFSLEEEIEIHLVTSTEMMRMLMSFSRECFHDMGGLRPYNIQDTVPDLISSKSQISS